MVLGGDFRKFANEANMQREYKRLYNQYMPDRTMKVKKVKHNVLNETSFTIMK